MRWDPQVERAFCLPGADGTLRMLEMIRVCDRMIRQREPVSIMEPTANRVTWLMLVSEQESYSRGTTSQKK